MVDGSIVLRYTMPTLVLTIFIEIRGVFMLERSRSQFLCMVLFLFVSWWHNALVPKNSPNWYTFVMEQQSIYFDWNLKEISLFCKESISYTISESLSSKLSMVNETWNSLSYLGSSNGSVLCISVAHPETTSLQRYFSIKRHQWSCIHACRQNTKYICYNV